MDKYRQSNQKLIDNFLTDVDISIFLFKEKGNINSYGEEEMIAFLAKVLVQMQKKQSGYFIENRRVFYDIYQLVRFRFSSFIKKVLF